MSKNLQLTCHGNKSIVVTLGDSTHHVSSSANRTAPNRSFFSSCRVWQSGQCGCPTLAWAALGVGLGRRSSRGFSLCWEPRTRFGLLFACLDRREKKMCEKSTVGGRLWSICWTVRDADGPQLQRGAWARDSAVRLGWAIGSGVGKRCIFTIFVMTVVSAHVSFCCCAVQISVNWHKSALASSPPPRRGRSHTLGGAANELLPPQRLVLVEKQCELCHWLRPSPVLRRRKKASPNQAGF